MSRILYKIYIILAIADLTRFRWVTCQIDYLCELHNDKQRRNALESLPPTLPKTYERILARVNESNPENQKTVQRALKWVAYAYEPLSLPQLVEIISVEESDERLDPEMIVDGSAIMTWCSSLLRLNDRGLKTASVDAVVEFSHFTVKEYLSGINPDIKSDFQPYSLASENSIHSELAKGCLRYLCLENFSQSFPRNLMETDELKRKHPFRDYTVLWPGHSKSCIDEDFSELSHKLFDPSKSHNFMCWTQAMISYHLGNTDSPDIYADLSTLHWACMIANPGLCRYLIERNEDVNKSSKLGTPLQCAVLGTSAIERANPNRAYIRRPQATDSDRAEVINLLLAGGAYLHTVYQRQNSPPVTLSSLVLEDYLFGYVGPSLVQVLLGAGMICDRRTLTTALETTKADVFANLQQHNLKEEDTVWYMEHFLTNTKVQKDVIPMVVTEDYLNVQERDSSKHSLGEIQSLLMAAAEFGQYKVVSGLIRRSKIDVNFRRISDGKTLLHLATSKNQLETVRVLLQFGADPLCMDAIEKTSLHLAAHHADGTAFQILLKAPSDVTQVDNVGLTALHAAALFGNVAVLSTLQQQFGNESFENAGETEDGRDLLLCACQSGSVQLIEFLVKILGPSPLFKTASDGSTALHHAVKVLSLTTTEYLLRHGLDANNRTCDGSAPLHMVVERDVAAETSEDSNKKSIIYVLLDHGAQIDARRDDDMTALSLLSSNTVTDGDFDALCAILNRKASVDVVDKKGRTPLYHMCDRLKTIEPWMDSTRNSLRVGNRLLEARSDANLPDHQMATPALYAFQAWYSKKEYSGKIYNEFLRTLLKHGSITDPNVINLEGKQLLTSAIEAGNQDLILEPLLSSCSVDKRDYHQNGYNAIEQACTRGCSKELLLHMLKLSKNPAVLSQTYKGQALLHRAALAGHTHLVETLLDAGAAVDIFTTESTKIFGVGSTALMLAASARTYASIDVLLDRSANVAAYDNSNWTALHHAVKNDNFQALDRLQLDCLPSEARVYFRTTKVYSGSFGNVSPFHLAAACGRYRIMEHLMKTYPKLDINHGAQFNITALHWACDSGHFHIVKLLLSSGACVDVTDNKGWTPLHVSAWDDHKEIVLYLLEHGADVRRRTLDSMCPKTLAICNGHLDLANVIGQHEAEPGTRSLSCL